MVVPQAPLVPTQLLGDPFGGGVKGGVELRGGGMRVDDDAAADPNGDLRPAQMRLPRDHDMGFDRRAEIFVENGAEAVFDMAPQGVADIDLLPVSVSCMNVMTPPARAGLPLMRPKVRTWERGNARSSHVVGIAAEPLRQPAQSANSFSRAAAPRMGCASLRDISPPSGGRSRRHPAAAIRRSVRLKVSSAGSRSIRPRMRWRTASAECAPLPCEAGLRR